MRKIFFLPLLLFLFSLSNAAVIKNVYWEPENPKPGQSITVYAEIEGNVSNVRLQYCIGDACFPVDMKKEGNLWVATIDGSEVKEGKIEVNVTADSEEGKIYMEKEITIKGKSTPGFEFLVAIAAMALLVKIKSKK